MFCDMLMSLRALEVVSENLSATCIMTEKSHVEELLTDAKNAGDDILDIHVKEVLAYINALVDEIFERYGF